MLMIESTMAVRFLTGSNICSSAALPHSRSICHAEDVAGVHVISRRPFPSGCSNIPWNGFRKLNGNSLIGRSNLIKKRIGASASDPVKKNERTRYHPSEDIVVSKLETGEDARLTAAETSRTIIEVNSKATLMFTDFINGVHENIIWPDLPYVTDEHGNIYIQVKNEEDILQSLTSENNFVQVIIGFDTTEMIKEMELAGLSEIDYGIDDMDEEDSDVEDDGEDEDEDEEDEDYDENWVNVLENEEDEDDEDETLGDWAKLETMRSSHPMYFAQKLSEAVADDPIDWMEQPPAGITIQGLLRPALIEEQSDIQKHRSSDQFHDVDISGNVVENKQEDFHIINGQRHESEPSRNGSEESKKDDKLIKGTSFYKLEMIKIQPIVAHAHQAAVEVDDYRKAQPDAIAHSAANIISRLKAGGEKITLALKSLCWRTKGIQVEEAAVIGVDSLGFDLRVCAGTHIQTLRFAFNTRAASESSAERQLNDLLFPRILSAAAKRETDVSK